jgi:hypothetical protein
MILFLETSASIQPRKSLAKFLKLRGSQMAVPMGVSDRIGVSRIGSDWCIPLCSQQRSKLSSASPVDLPAEDGFYFIGVSILFSFPHLQSSCRLGAFFRYVICSFGFRIGSDRWRGLFPIPSVGFSYLISEDNSAPSSPSSSKASGIIIIIIIIIVSGRKRTE